MKVIHYDSSYLEEFLDFYKRIWPGKSIEYIKYRLFEFPEQSGDENCNLLVISDDGSIIGCNLYFSTKAKINGLITKVYWSHDTYILERFRGDAGLLLISEAFKLKSTFGVGLSEINFKIQKKIGAVFLGSFNHYFLFNFWSVKLFFPWRKKIERQPDKFVFPEIIKTGGIIFKRIYSVDDLRIPKNGFWNSDNSDNSDIDFIRDYHFLKTRFFDNFREYIFYKTLNQSSDNSDDCYFVIRPAYEGGIQVLSLVDFRYNLKYKFQFDSIIKACSKIGRMNKVALVTVKTNVMRKHFCFYPLYFVLNSKEKIITYLHNIKWSNFIITKADSDLDFITK